MDVASSKVAKFFGEKQHNRLTPENPHLLSLCMKTNSSLLALILLVAITALLSTSAEAGNRRANNPPPVTSSTAAPVVSLP